MPKKLTYKQAYIKCLDIASDSALKVERKKELFNLAWEMYQKMGALMLRLPRERK